MIGSRRRNALVAGVLACAALALPAAGWASGTGAGPGGGSGLGPSDSTAQSSPPPSPGAGGTQTGVQSGNTTVSTSGDGITLAAKESAMLRKGLTFTGTAPSHLAGDTIEIERSGHQTHWQWTPTASSTVGPDGSFSARWHTNHIGRFAIRAVVSSSSVAQSASATPPLTITVYRPSLATQYGPGFYGHRTACGVKLTRATVGVANRTLKCGTDVAVYYRGRTMIVPVIDRGPYANGADWDLTRATGRALGIGGTARIGAVSLPAR